VLERLSADRVEQRIDGDGRGVFDKEVLRAETTSGRKLALVRKRRATGPSLGAVVLIHGFAQNRYSWHLEQRSLVNFLADRGLDTYNLELAGHGRSRDFGTAPAAAFSDYVDDCAEVLEAVAAYSGHPKVFVMGHSMGGAVCYAVAPRCSERIAGVITMGGIYYFGRNPLLAQIARLLTVVDRKSSVVRRLGLGFNTSALGGLLVRLLPLADELSWSLPIAGWVPGSTEKSIISERVSKGFDWTGLGVCMQMMGWATSGRFDGEDNTDYRAEFARLDLPLLVVAGNEDRLATPADVRPAWEESTSSDKTYREFSPEDGGIHWGHLCIVLGAQASLHVWPLLADWMLQRCNVEGSSP
jgi:alpha-beta hydrolase superfamily lysophospholipase